jgi:hypothetical protein
MLLNYFFIYNLFNDAFSSSDYIALNERTILNNELEIALEGSCRGPIQGTIPEFFWKD